MVEFLQWMFFAVACVTIPLCLLFWLLAIDRVVHGQPLVAWSPRRAPPWTILDLLALVILTVIMTTIAQLLVAAFHGLPIDEAHLGNAELKPVEQVSLVGAFSVATFQVWVLGLLWMVWRAGASPNDLGWRDSQRAADLRLGLVAFVMLVVPMLGIHYLAQKAFPTEDGHPFIEIVIKNPRLEYLIPIIVAAVLVAPIVEEYMFRVFLQGWMERWAFPATRNLAKAGPVPQTADCVDGTAEDAATPPQLFGDLADRPHAIAAAESVVDALLAETEDNQQKTCWWPIVISGLLFGLAHLGQGPAPIPLAFLGLGLGYLYQRTHRVLPCIVVHFLVNATAVIQLAVYITQQQAAS